MVVFLESVILAPPLVPHIRENTIDMEILGLLVVSCSVYLLDGLCVSYCLYQFWITGMQHSAL